MQRVGVIGGGAWGTALALAALRAGRDVVLWARDAETVNSINTRHENARYLPGISLDPALRATDSMAEAADCDILLLVTPAQAMREIGTALAPHMAVGTPVALCSKGIELNTGLLMSEVAAQVLSRQPLAVLSGPTFAGEVARGLPTAVTLACTDEEIGQRLITVLGSRNLRPYLSTDVIGAEVAGAVKNVLAIACGIVEGRGLGQNARAALITRGLAEITRLVLKLGGRAETMMGLSGLGDLTLTCTSLQSRNMSFGFELGSGRTAADILGERHSVAEGLTTARAVVELATRQGVDMPICSAVDAILNQGADIDTTVTALLSRPFRSE